jgi:FkbM family methyltransferase
MAEYTQSKAGPIRQVLRACMRAASRFFPNTPTVRQTKFHGFDLLVWANEYIGRRILTVGSFEKDEMARLPSFVRPGDTCVDVGANIGLHTLSLARAVGATGHVFSFEPVRKNALLAQLNCEINNLHNVTMTASPLSDVSGKILSANLPDNDSSFAFFSETGGMGDEGATRTLDEFCESRTVAAVHFIKIDVEGAEMKILRGASRLLSSPGAPRVVMVEMVDDYLRRFGDNKRDAVAFMSALGYKPFVVRGGQLTAVTVETIDTENVYFQKV